MEGQSEAEPTAACARCSALHERAVEKIPDLLAPDLPVSGTWREKQPDVVIGTVDFHRGRCSHLVGTRLHRNASANDLIARDLVLALDRRPPQVW